LRNALGVRAFSISPQTPGVSMDDFVYAPPQILPGSVLDRVVTGDEEDRFKACVRISMIVWKYGLQSCPTQIARDDWRRRYLEHLQSEINF